MDLYNAQSRMIAAHVDADGTILSNPTGGLLRVRKDGRGLYMALFDEPFIHAPAIIATHHYPGGSDFSNDGGNPLENACVVSFDAYEIKIKVGDANGNAADRQFSFIASGLVENSVGQQGGSSSGRYEQDDGVEDYADYDNDDRWSERRTDERRDNQREDSSLSLPDRNESNRLGSNRDSANEPSAPPLPGPFSGTGTGEATIVGNQAVTDSIGVVTVEGNRPYVFVKGSDGNFWVNWWTGSEWEWLKLGGPPS